MWNRTKIQLLMWLFKILVYFPSLLYLETTTLIALKEERSARLAGATCWNIPPKKERKINFNNRRNTTEVCKCFCYLTVFLGCLYFITVSKHTAKMLQYQAVTWQTRCGNTQSIHSEVSVALRGRAAVSTSRYLYTNFTGRFETFEDSTVSAVNHSFLHH